VATAGLLVRRQATLLEHYLAAHADGHLDPAERRHLRELLAPFIDDLVGLDATLAADELPGERR
jgi:tellurite resistance protein